MENVVNLMVTHVEAEVVRAKRMSDAEGTNVPVVELLGRSDSVDVSFPK